MTDLICTIVSRDSLHFEKYRGVPTKEVKQPCKVSLKDPVGKIYDYFRGTFQIDNKVFCNRVLKIDSILEFNNKFRPIELSVHDYRTLIPNCSIFWEKCTILCLNIYRDIDGNVTKIEESPSPRGKNYTGRMYDDRGSVYWGAYIEFPYDTEEEAINLLKERYGDIVKL